MDWMNRGTRQNQPINQPVNHTGMPGNHSGHRKKLKDQGLFKIASVTLLFSATLLIVALLFYIAFGSKPNTEAKYVDTSKYQAVFLNGGQVYFGHIKTLNSKYVRIDTIFYLRVNQVVQPNGQQQASNPELVPLGCELHRPQNQMVINRDQVIFWENLKDESSNLTVPGAITQYLKDHPSGQQTCTAATTDSSSAAPAATTPAPATTKKP